MAKIIRIDEHFQHFLAEMKDRQGRRGDGGCDGAFFRNDHLGDC
jgi:hypothetical protein